MFADATARGRGFVITHLPRARNPLLGSDRSVVPHNWYRKQVTDMGHRLRLGMAAATCVVIAVAAGCSRSPGSSSSSPAPASSPSSAAVRGTLTVFGAGTLDTPFTAEIQAFTKANPGVTVHSQFGASGDMVKDVTQVGQPDDVLGVADYSLIPKLMSDPSKPHASWYVGFVSHEITLAYPRHSKGAAQLTP